VLGYVLPLLVWQIVASRRLLPEYVLPTPVDAASALWRDGTFIGSNLAVTLQEVGLGFGIAVAGALAWSAVFISVPILRRAVYPLMVAANVAPKELLGPVVILWFGFSLLPKVLMAAVIAFFPVLVGTMVGLERFDTRIRLVASSMGASRLKTFFSFRLWNALPSFLSSLKLGLTLAIVGAVLGEFLGSDRGIGYAILSAGRRLDGASLYANLAVLVAVSLVLVGIVERVQRALFKGTRSATGASGHMT
jgi:NitT/TauT family transport system permease protein